MAFPPSLPSIQHVTINSFAQKALSHRRGESSVLVPNVLDFEQPPPEPDEHALRFREDIGVAEDDILFLQPTRIVPRKGIEHSIQLLTLLNDPRCKLVISHESGDEGDDYKSTLMELAESGNVTLIFADTHIGDKRHVREDGTRTYTLADAYSQADFITYPSIYEGFGNGLLEAFYFRKPILVNRYSIFIADIEPRGIQVIAMNGLITQDIVNNVRQVMNDASYRKKMTEHNYDLSRMFFSYSVLRRSLRALITNFTGHDDL
jgi:glycosyltransferase involved in cell wall biosynthesis